MKVRDRLIAPAKIGRLAIALATLIAVSGIPTPTFAAKPVRLMIDPGHGGKDPGAAKAGMREKDVNLQVSKLVYRAARRQGWAVEMTRYDDTFIPLGQRPRKAAQFDATALVSVHVNSTGNKTLGAMTIHRGGSSARLGRSIMTELDPLTKYKDIGNRQDVRGLAVLRGATTPAVIAELRSLSASAERQTLKSPRVQRQLAEAIVRGVARFHGVKYTPPGQPKRAPKSAPKREAKREVKPRLKPKTVSPLMLAVEPTATASAPTTSAVEPTATPSVASTNAVEPTATPSSSTTSAPEPTPIPRALPRAASEPTAAPIGLPVSEAAPSAPPMGLPVLGIDTKSPLESPKAVHSGLQPLDAVWHVLLPE